MTPRRPPRITDLALRLLVGSSPASRSIRGDLHAEFAARCAASPRAARRWYRRQACSVIGHYAVLRRLRPGLTVGVASHRSAEQRIVKGLLHDIRYGARSLVRAPGYSCLAVLTLGLGVAATTSIFSVAYGVLVVPLPYPDSDRIVQVGFIAPRALCERFWGGEGCERLIGVSAPNFIDWRERSRTLTALAGIRRDALVVTGDGDPVRLPVARVTEDFFDVTGVAPGLGRRFAAAEFEPGAENVAMITHELWQARWGGDPEILGRVIRATDRRLRIVGVLPPGTLYPGSSRLGGIDVYLPLAVTAPELANRSQRGLNLVARMAPGVTVDEANAELAAIAAALAPLHPEDLTFEGDASSAGVASLQQAIVGDLRAPLSFLLGAVGLLMLISCANVANLGLARGSRRGGEIAVRAALGAGRGRVVRQLLIENFILSAVGGVAGVLLAYWVIGIVARLNPLNIPRMGAVGVNLAVLAFALALTVTTGVLSGIAPGLRLARTNTVDGLRGAGGASDGRAATRLRSALVVAEIALALVLLVGAGLLFNTFVRLSAADPGVEADAVVTVRMPFGAAQQEGSAAQAFISDVLERVRTHPSVASAGAVVDLPLDGISWLAGVVAARNDSPESAVAANGHIVTEGSFEALGIVLESGRLFDERDLHPAATGVVVSRGLADALWPDEDAVGRQLRLPAVAIWPLLEVIGVVEDVRQDGLRTAPRPSLYVPHTRIPDLPAYGGMHLVVRYRGELREAAAGMKQAVSTVDSNLPLQPAMPLETRYDAALAPQRFTTSLIGAFATIALLLAVSGIYGTMSTVVEQRSRELGIRVALGAHTADIRSLLLRQAAVITVAGLAVGVAGAWVLSSSLESLVYEVSVTDPLTFAGVVLVVACAAALASWLPARRAARISPVSILRTEA